MSSTAPPPSAESEKQAAEVVIEWRMYHAEVVPEQKRLLGFIASALDSASRKAREECARAVCPECANGSALDYRADRQTWIYFHRVTMPSGGASTTGCVAQRIHARWPPAPRPPAEEEK